MAQYRLGILANGGMAEGILAEALGSKGFEKKLVLKAHPASPGGRP